MGIVGCNVIRTLLVGFGQRLSRVSIFFIGLGYFGAVGALTYAVLAEKADPFVGWIYLAGFAAVGLVVLLAIASFLQGVLGVELAWAGFGFLTTVESSPDAALHKIEVVTLPATQDTAEGIRHAVYLHPECVPRIVAGLGL